MSDFDKILLTASLTVLGGFVIHSASQLFLKLFVEPIQDFRKNRSQVISLLSFYSNMFSFRLRPGDSEEYRTRYFKANDEIRMCMSNIKASYYSISPRWLAVIMGVIPNQSIFGEVTKNLLSLSFLGALDTENDKLTKNMDLAQATLNLLGAEW